jgi:hypothetical protein
MSRRQNKKNRGEYRKAGVKLEPQRESPLEAPAPRLIVPAPRLLIPKHLVEERRREREAQG